MVKKSGPHDQKSYLLGRSLVFSFRFFFFVLDFILWIHRDRWLIVVYSSSFLLLFYTCEIELKGDDFLGLIFDF